MSTEFKNAGQEIRNKLNCKEVNYVGHNDLYDLFEAKTQEDKTIKLKLKITGYLYEEKPNGWRKVEGVFFRNESI